MRCSRTCQERLRPWGFACPAARAESCLVVAESSAFGDTPVRGESSNGLRPTGSGHHRRDTAVDVGRTLPDNARHPFYDATTIFPDRHASSLWTSQRHRCARWFDSATAYRCRGPEFTCLRPKSRSISWMSFTSRAGEPRDAGGAKRFTWFCRAPVMTEWCRVHREPLRNAGRLRRRPAGRLWRAGHANARPPRLRSDFSPWASRQDHESCRGRSTATPSYSCGRYSPIRTHPAFELPMPTESGPAPYRHIPPTGSGPRCCLAATPKICHKLLNLGRRRHRQVDLDGVLFTADQP